MIFKPNRKPVFIFTLLVALILKSTLLFADIFVYALNYASGDLSVIDTATNTNIADIPVGPANTTRGLAISPDGLFVYVGSPTLNEVVIVDTTTNSVSGSIPATNPFGIAVSPDGAFLYVVQNIPGNSVAVFDRSNNSLITTIPVGINPNPNPFYITLTPDGNFAYVANQTEDTISVINTTTNTIQTTINPAGNGPFKIAMTPNGNYAYVTNGVGATVSVIDLSTNLIISTIPVGSAPRGLAVTPNGDFVYVMCPGDSSIRKISTATNTEVANIAATPLFDIAITSDGAFAYLTDIVNDTTELLDLTTDTFVDSISVVNQPRDIVITPVLSVFPDNPTPFLTISGAYKRDHFLTETDLINVIEWSAPSNNTIPQSYKIYRDSKLIATIPGDKPRVFEDHNRKKNKSYTYMIAAEVFGEGQTDILASGTIVLRYK
ncbi:MAG: YncE family protein [Chlamydiales bacterium]|nr:YncE family protein [Chlamydiales bacterium]